MFRIGHGFDVHKFGGAGPVPEAGELESRMSGVIRDFTGDVFQIAI